MIFSKSFDLLGWPLFSAISLLSHFPWRVLGLNITLFATVSASSSSSQSYLRIQTDISFPEANTSVKRNWCLFQIWMDRKILRHLLSTYSEPSTAGTLHVSLLILRTISLRIKGTEAEQLTEATQLWVVGLVPVHGPPPEGSLASAAGSAETPPIAATLTSSPNATKPSWLPPGWGQGFSTVSRVRPSRSSHGSSNPAPPTSGQTDRRTGSPWGFWGSSAPGAGTWLPRELCACVGGEGERGGREERGESSHTTCEHGRHTPVPSPRLPVLSTLVPHSQSGSCPVRPSHCLIFGRPGNAPPPMLSCLSSLLPSLLLLSVKPTLAQVLLSRKCGLRQC